MSAPTGWSLPLWAIVVAALLVVATALGSWGVTAGQVATSVGEPGPAGAPGPAGPAGSAGLAGPAGATGPTGPTGTQGATGPAGSTGSAGAPGAPGADGATGATGATGPAGPQGAKGASGAVGDPGLTGPVGATGATGAQGALGPQGAAGATGPAGDDGPISVYTTSTFGTNERRTQTLVLSEGTWFVVLTAAVEQNPAQGQGVINCTLNTVTEQGPTQNPVMNFTLFEDDIESPSAAFLMTTDGVTHNTVKADCGGGSAWVIFLGLTLTATRVTEVYQP